MIWVAGGQDYSGISEVLVFQPGVSELCTSFITIIGDALIEPTEEFLISLTSINTDTNVGGNVLATILDDDRTLLGDLLQPVGCNSIATAVQYVYLHLSLIHI